MRLCVSLSLCLCLCLCLCSVSVLSLFCLLADTGEHGETTVTLGDVVNQLHDQDSLADTGTTEETDLASLGVRVQEILNLDTSAQRVGVRALRLVGEQGCVGVNGEGAGSANWPTFVDWLSNNVGNTAKQLRTDQDIDWGASVFDFGPAHLTLGGSSLQLQLQAVALIGICLIY